MSEMSQKRKGVFCMIFSAFSFSIMNLCVKLAGDLPAIEKSFFRNLVAVLVAFIMLKKSGGGFHVKKGNLPVLILRSVLGTIGIFANFYAISHLVLPDATMLNKLSPFCTLLFSFLFLGEELIPLQVAGIVIAFIGSAFIIKPSFDLTATMPALIGAIGGICAGGAYTCVRCLGKRGERGPMIVFFFSVFSCLAAVPFMIADFHPITLSQFLILMGAGAGAAGGQFGITAAYRYAPAGEISIYDYSTVFFAAIWGFLAFGEVPDGLSIVGYIMIFAMSLLMFLYNGRRAQAQD
jgi:drug/metabolite transporter (DMT)-like permease